jgi:hypothetical protein
MGLLNRSRRLVLLIVISAFVISAAWGSSAEAFIWGIEGSAVVEAGESETTSLNLKSATSLVLSGIVAGLPVELKATGLSGVETKIEGETARDSGKYKLEGVSLVKPAGCGTSTTLETKPLKGELVEVGKTLYDKLIPAEGSTLLTLTLTGECALGGTSIKLTGTEFAQVEPVETRLVEQPLKFSPTILSAAGGSIALGGNAAQLTFEALAKLKGLQAGQKFGPGQAAKYRSNANPATPKGTQFSMGQVFQFKMKAFTCDKVTLAGAAFAGGMTAAMKLGPTYNPLECDGLGYPTARIKPEGCEFEFLEPTKVGAIYEAKAKLFCPAMKEMIFEAEDPVAGLECVIKMPKQNLGKWDLTNEAGPPKWVKAKAAWTKLHYSVTTSVGTCPIPQEARTDGTFDGELKLTAEGGNELFVN